MSPLFLLNIQVFNSQMTKTWCVGGRQCSNAANDTIYEKRNPKSIKFVEIIKASCSICQRNKSQNFTE